MGMKETASRWVDPGDKEGIKYVVADEGKMRKICILVTSICGCLLSVIFCGLMLGRFVATQNMQKVFAPVNPIDYPIYDTGCVLGFPAVGGQTAQPYLFPTVTNTQIRATGAFVVAGVTLYEGQIAVYRNALNTLLALDENQILQAVLAGDSSLFNGLPFEFDDLLDDFFRSRRSLQSFGDLTSGLNDLQGAAGAAASQAQDQALAAGAQALDLAAAANPVAALGFDTAELLRLAQNVAKAGLEELDDLIVLAKEGGEALSDGNIWYSQIFDGRTIYDDKNEAIGLMADIIDDCSNDPACYRRGSMWSMLYFGQGLILLAAALVFCCGAFGAFIAPCRQSWARWNYPVCLTNFICMIIAGTRRFSKQGQLCAIFNGPTGASSDSIKDWDDSTTYKTDGALIVAVFVFQLLGSLCCCMLPCVFLMKAK